MSSHLTESGYEGHAPCIDPAQVLAWEEWQCLEGVKGINYHLWRPQMPAVALGISQNPDRELHVNVVKSDGCKIVRRPSGGGAVVLIDGVLAFGVLAEPSVFSSKYAIHEAFDLLTRPVRQAVAKVAKLPQEAVIAGISDLAVEMPMGLRKICGCAQMRKKNAVLVHGTILVKADISLLERYLAWPSEVPDYRKGRSHRNFCVNVAEISPDPLEISALATEISLLADRAGWSQMQLPSVFAEDCQKLVTLKYRSDDWNCRGRRPVI